MRIRANTPFGAKQEILRIIATTDYHHAAYPSDRYGHIYVYYNPEYARFTFEHTQRKHQSGLLKRYKEKPDIEDAIRIAAEKFTFAQIMTGAVLSRKIISQREYFILAKEHFDWI